MSSFDIDELNMYEDGDDIILAPETDAFTDIEEEPDPDKDLEMSDLYQPSPLDKVEYVGDLEADARAEIDAITSALSEADLEAKRAFQEQDKRQRQQFENLYDTNYYFSEVYRTREECERAKRIQARILGIDYEAAGFGPFRRGDMVMIGFRRIAKKLEIDISDLE